LSDTYSPLGIANTKEGRFHKTTLESRLVISIEGVSGLDIGQIRFLSQGKNRQLSLYSKPCSCITLEIRKQKSRRFPVGFL